MGCDSPSSSSYDSLTILFTGDVLLDRGVRPVAEKKGVEKIFSGVSDEFKKADAVVINLECPFTDTISPINKKFIFRADSKWAADLRRVGVTHAVMANNHTNDQGRRGLVATDYHLHRVGIVPLGYGNNIDEQLAPTLVEKGDNKVAIFTATTLTIENWFRTDGKPGISQPTAEELTATISKFHTNNPDTKIITVLHWGVEFQQVPSINQRRLAHILADAGTDVIIGHHPHVVQPCDTIDNTVVFYSLGNFVFDQHPPQTRKGLIAKVTVQKSGVNHPEIETSSIPIEIKDNCPILKTRDE